MGKQTDSKKHKEAIGSFLGFVSLSEPEWNKKIFIENMKKLWNLDVRDEKNDPSTLIFHIEKAKTVLAYMDRPVAYLDMYKKEMAECFENETSHSAQIIIYTDGNEDIIKKSLIFTKVAYSILCDENAINIYTDSAINSKEKYMDCLKKYLNKERFPVLNLVWIGKSKGGLYTRGMKKFSKNEMEIYDSKSSVEELEDVFCKIIENVIKKNIDLKKSGEIKISNGQIIPAEYDSKKDIIRMDLD